MTKHLKPSDVQKAYGYDPSTLRQWESQGLISPIRTPGGHRRYTDAMLQNVAKAEQKQTMTRRNQYREFGTTGLRQWSGSVHEERLRELRGRAGRIMYREMRLNDPVIGAVFFALGNALKQVSWRVQAASEDSADVEAAELVESCLTDLSFSLTDQMAFAIEPTLEQGFSLLEIVYKRRLGEKPPKYTENPGKSQFDDGLIGWRKFAPRPAESLAQGREWDFDEYGGLQGIWQLPDVDFSGHKMRYIPIEKLLHFRTTPHPANNPEGVPIHRGMYLPYYFSRNIQEVEGIGIERDLAGIPVMYLGSGASLEGENSDYQKSLDLVTNIRNDEQVGVVIPGPKLGTGDDGQGYLLELLSSGGSRQYNTSEILDRYDKRKAVSVLAQFIMLGMSNQGSYALSRHQGDVFILAASAFMKHIADVFNRHAIPRLIKMNRFGRLSGMPKMIPSALGVPDLKGLSDYVNKLVDKELLTPDAELERHLRQAAELPERNEDTPQVMSPQKAVRKVREIGLAYQIMQRQGLVNDQQVKEGTLPYVEQMQAALMLGKTEQPAQPAQATQATNNTLSPREQKQMADVGNTFSQEFAREIEAGALSVRVARQRMVEQGLLNLTQFENLELDDGRLPDGTSVLALFNSPDEVMQDMLDLGVADPANVLDNDATNMLIEINAALQDVEEIVLTVEDDAEAHQAKQALAALNTLQSEYQQVLAQSIAQSIVDTPEATDDDEGDDDTSNE